MKLGALLNTALIPFFVGDVAIVLDGKIIRECEPKQVLAWHRELEVLDMYLTDHGCLAIRVKEGQHEETQTNTAPADVDNQACHESQG